MKVDELRQTYLDFFKSKGHQAFASDSLVPADDPSLLFTGAGMNQFKPYFLGLKKDVKRATSCQKCLRTADLDRVGKTNYHHSFFEMLGNFSFGDYFKEEAIAYGWEFVTKVMKIPTDNLWVSVYEEDDEAFAIWKNKIGVPEARIVRMGAEDNFWPSNAPKDGPNGPCGPCSEIYVGKVPGKGVEIWNLVFTQFDRQSDGSLLPLPQKNIDTGMGLERAASVLQGVESNFDIDTFKKIRQGLQALMRPGSSTDRAHENATMDHARAAIFSIADGALPSNEGRGYVVRKLIRLGSDHFEKAGTPLTPRTFFKLAPVIVGVYGAAYPDIQDREKTILSILENEERAYEDSCRRAEGARQGSMSVDEFAFMLYDTYGLPVDKIKDKFSSDGMVFNEAKFSEYLNQQKQRSRQSSKLTGEIFTKTNLYTFIEGVPPTTFLGYDEAECADAALLRIIKNDAVAPEISQDEEGMLLFDRSVFYAESGGQIGDTGLIEGPGFRAEVLDTQYLEKCIGHKVRVLLGKAVIGQKLVLKVDAKRRADIMKNHTATHLLQSALRKTLGDHVKQSGSLVSQDYLRFDFTHFSAVDAKAMAAIELLVNAQIQKNITLSKRVMTKEGAVQEGAIAFFGEKYGDQVRVVTIGDFSKELCGGTHLNSTGEIGLFKIVSEGSIQAGVRRIEALTGRAAMALTQDQDNEIEALSREFGVDNQALPAELKKTQERVSAARNRLTQLAAGRIKSFWDKTVLTPALGEVAVLTQRVDGADAELLKQAAESLKTSPFSYAVLLASGAQDKISMAVAASPDLVQKGFHSGKIVKEISVMVDGNGGGRPDFAIGGGKNVLKAAEAIQWGERQIRREVDGLLSGTKS